MEDYVKALREIEEDDEAIRVADAYCLADDSFDDAVAKYKHPSFIVMDALLYIENNIILTRYADEVNEISVKDVAKFIESADEANDDANTAKEILNRAVEVESEHPELNFGLRLKKHVIEGYGLESKEREAFRKIAEVYYEELEIGIDDFEVVIGGLNKVTNKLMYFDEAEIDSRDYAVLKVLRDISTRTDE